MTGPDPTQRQLATHLHELFPEAQTRSILPGVERLRAQRTSRRRVGLGLALAMVIAASVAVPTMLSAGTGGKTVAETHTVGPGAGNGPADASCSDAVRFRGHIFAADTLSNNPESVKVVSRTHMSPIAQVQRPYCRDTNLQTAPPPSKITLARITGLNPDVTLAIYATGRVYQRIGMPVPSILRSAPWIRLVKVGQTADRHPNP